MRKILVGCTLLVGMAGVVRAEDQPPLAPIRFNGELAARGRVKKRAGVALMTVGTASAIASIALIINGAMGPRDDTGRCGAGLPCQHERGGATDIAQLDSGVVLAVVGTLLNLAGVGTYVAGKNDVERAQPQLSFTASGMRLVF